MNNARKTDKIFGNSFNEGLIGNVNTDVIVIDEFYKRSMLNSEYDPDSSYMLDKLSDIVYGYIKESKYRFILRDKKIIKKIVPELLIFILEKFEDNEDVVIDYTFPEMFMVLCMVLDLKGNVVYDNLPTSFKDDANDSLKNYISVDGENNKNIII